MILASPPETWHPLAEWTSVIAALIAPIVWLGVLDRLLRRTR